MRQIAIGITIGFTIMTMILTGWHGLQAHPVHMPPSNVLCSSWEHGERICDDGIIEIIGSTGRHRP